MSGNTNSKWIFSGISWLEGGRIVTKAEDGLDRQAVSALLEIVYGQHCIPSVCFPCTMTWLIFQTFGLWMHLLLSENQKAFSASALSVLFNSWFLSLLCSSYPHPFQPAVSICSSCLGVSVPSSCYSLSIAVEILCHQECDNRRSVVLISWPQHYQHTGNTESSFRPASLRRVLSTWRQSSISRIYREQN